MQVKLSIVTINYNNSAGLLKTIESVRDIKSTLIEYIVVDGNSSDDSDDIVRRNDDIVDHYINESDSGIYNAMNKGIKIANGRYVHLLNSGDIYTNRDWLKVLKSLDFDVDFIAYSVLKIIDSSWRIRQPKSNFFEDFVDAPHPGIIVKREVYFNNVYNETLRIASDSLFIYNNMRPSNTLIVPLTLVKMSAAGISQLRISYLHEKERVLLLWKYGYRKKVRVFLQINYFMRLLWRCIS